MASLEILQCGADIDLCRSTLKSQVSALSVFQEKKLASNPLLLRFLKGSELTETGAETAFSLVGSVYGGTNPDRGSSFFGGHCREEGV